jgi:hypothetical protein
MAFLYRYPSWPVSRKKSPHNQGCGSGSVSGLDLDSMGCLDLEPDSESGYGSRDKKNKKMEKKS